jgi:hypothetical protein
MCSMVELRSTKTDYYIAYFLVVFEFVIYLWVISIEILVRS